MGTAAIVRRAWTAFRADAIAAPPLTLRGANAVDGYDQPPPFDPAADHPTDAYVEAFAFWGITHLDARSWRHYVPRLIDYAFRHPRDPAMVTEALIRSLRPPDRYPPRLATLDADQECVVRTFLEAVALGDALPYVQADAQQALEEWWLPNPRCRPTAGETAVLRAAPVAHHLFVRDVYRLSVPETLTGSGSRAILQESRRIETFGGYLCGDAPTVVAVTVTPRGQRSMPEAVRAAAVSFVGAMSSRSIVVTGSRRAVRLDGMTQVGGPAEPQRLAMVLAVAADALVILSVRWWPRDDVSREVERILDSFDIIES